MVVYCRNKKITPVWQWCLDITKNKGHVPGGVSKHFFEGVPVGFFEVVNEALCFGLLWNVKIQNKTYKFMISIKNVVRSMNVGNFLRYVSVDKNVWIKMVEYECIWKCMKLYDGIWLYMNVNGSIWMYITVIKIYFWTIYHLGLFMDIYMRALPLRVCK